MPIYLGGSFYACLYGLYTLAYPESRGGQTIRRAGPKFLAGHTIKFLAQFGRFEVKEGGGVEGVAILEFRSFAEAEAWYESPAYQNASQHRHKGEDYSAVIVEGVQP